MAYQPDPPATEPPDDGDDKERTPRESLVELILIVGVALGLALVIQAFVVKPYRIPSESMVPTLQVGQRVLVDRIQGRFGTPHRGQVVVFHPPAADADGDPTCGVKNGQQYAPGRIYSDGSGPNINEKMPCPFAGPGKFDEVFIKRVVGMPGDSLSVRQGRVYIDGRELNEPYLPATNSCQHVKDISSDCNFPTPVVIPPNHYFMMGDNRNQGGSFDSRFWGSVPKSKVIGEAFLTYWPPGRMGRL